MKRTRLTGKASGKPMGDRTAEIMHVLKQAKAKRAFMEDGKEVMVELRPEEQTVDGMTLFRQRCVVAGRRLGIKVGVKRCWGDKRFARISYNGRWQ